MTARHASLVVGSQRGPWPRQPPGVCMEGAGILQGAQGVMPHVKGGQ